MLREPKPLLVDRRRMAGESAAVRFTRAVVEAAEWKAAGVTDLEGDDVWTEQGDEPEAERHARG